jgi:curved DNA-binding protein CbpA
MRRYYDVLDLSEDATPEQVEKAYKRAASKHHPDKNIGNEADAAERFKECKEAYECLIDPERRKIYDETGDTSVQNGNPAEDLFLHLLNEVTDHMESTCEVLEKVRSVLTQMIDECTERKFQTDRRMVVLNSMIKAVRFKGKGANIVEAVLQDKLKKLTGERAELDAAVLAGRAAFDYLKDYSATDRPSPMSQEETAQSLRIKTIEAMMRGVFGGGGPQGRRPGGFPFSGV